MIETINSKKLESLTHISENWKMVLGLGHHGNSSTIAVWSESAFGI